LLPFQVTWLPLVKPVPLTVRVNAAVPATAELGDRLVRVAAGLMMNGTAGGEGCPTWETVTIALPGASIRDAGTMAVNCPELTKVVESAPPFQVIWVVLVKPAPFTVRRNPGPPAVALCGTMLLIDSAAVMVKVRGAGTGGSSMVTDAVPTAAISAAGTIAVNCPLFTNVVESSSPFHVTRLPLTKFAPFTVRVNVGPPTTAEFGERLERVAAGMMVKVTGGGEVCPVSATVTMAVPGDAMRLAEIKACTIPELKKVVGSAALFQVIWVAAVKPAPFTVRLNPLIPATAFGGKTLLIESASVMVKVRGAGCGVALMVTDAVPGEAIKAAGTVAVNWPALMKLVPS